MPTAKPPPDQARRPQGAAPASHAWIIGLVGVAAVLLLLFALVSWSSP
jgi:hypothetical protein